MSLDACESVDHRSIKGRNRGGRKLPGEFAGGVADDVGAQRWSLPTFRSARERVSGTGRSTRRWGAGSFALGGKGWSDDDGFCTGSSEQMACNGQLGQPGGREEAMLGGMEEGA